MSPSSIEYLITRCVPRHLRQKDLSLHATASSHLPPATHLACSTPQRTAEFLLFLLQVRSPQISLYNRSYTNHLLADDLRPDQPNLYHSTTSVRTSSTSKRSSSRSAIYRLHICHHIRLWSVRTSSVIFVFRQTDVPTSQFCFLSRHPPPSTYIPWYCHPFFANRFGLSRLLREMIHALAPSDIASAGSLPT